ncbi:endonuclease domain-containing protein [Paenibacillus sp. ATY16]|uniref:endonuclease domain-containing protein n=1 Tax=Paenibacillus sp. ATY16 TaxID=1759312 RepID=UPI00200D1434|nr:endonuclease domain-containing protein [Paenibacillus sp. ATY16]MCK9861981.1 endonuclease domain-containing protein [Paenibacillus sp. ATY16]
MTFNDDYEEAHRRFIETHMEGRTGERKGRLSRGHNFAEKLFLQNVWWPLFGSFEHLHPEYEVYDWNRKSQFIDFAYLPPQGMFAIECDGFQSHVKDMDREKFSYSLNRDTFLTGMGWKMIHFSFDDVQNRPEICIMLLKHVLGTHMIRGRHNAGSLFIPSFERDILRLAFHTGGRVGPKNLSDYFRISFRTARKRLQSLAAKGMLKPIERGVQIRYYELNDRAIEHL